MTQHVLHTIGYKGHDIGSYLDVLEHAGVRRLIDVRRTARSRKRDFNKNRLRTHCEARGIEYVHVSELGAPKAARDRYLDDGAWEPFAAAFASYLTTEAGRRGLQELRVLAALRPSAITCLCGDPARCHRGLLAVAVRDDFEVRHLPGPDALAQT